LSVFVDVFSDNVEIDAPDVICIDQEAEFSVNLTGLQNIQWTPATIFPNPNTTPVVISPQESVTVGFSAISSNGCAVIAEHFLQVDTTLPIINLVDFVRICEGASADVTVSGGNAYLWNDQPGIAPLDAPTVTLSPDSSGWFFITAFNACGESYDSLFVEVVVPEITAGNDTIICPGEIAFAWADGGVSYAWQPETFVSQITGNTAILRPATSTVYTVYGTDQYGCIGTAEVFVELFPLPFVQTTPDIYAFLGDPIEISAEATSSGSYSWHPPTNLSCPNCQTTGVSTQQNATYTVQFVDENGCIAQDNISISFDAIIYVPNTFTPDGDRFNPIFKPEGGNIVEFHMLIFNRWGEIMFESYNFNIGWDGTYGGKVCQDGTYVWVIEYKDNSNNKERLVGHVNLLK
jgi:gliding motility-associated-like protein